MQDGSRGIMVIDVRRVYFYAASTRWVYVEIPLEDWEKVMRTGAAC